mgnify:CR=1 FL=1
MPSVPASDGLAARQEQVLKHLRELPLAPIPPLRAEQLTAPPVAYRLVKWIPLFGLALSFCFLLYLPFIKVHDMWDSSVPLRTGSSVRLLTTASQAIRFGGERGTLVLQGPAKLEFDRLDRRFLGGGVEAKLFLHEGELLFQTRPGGRHWIQIRVPGMTVQAKGTQLLIGHHPERGSRLRVLEGTVEVLPKGGEWQELSTGAELTVRPNGSVAREFSMEESQGADLLPLLPSPLPLRRLLWREEG